MGKNNLIILLIRKERKKKSDKITLLEFKIKTF